MLPLMLRDLTFTVQGRRIIDGITLAIEAGPRTVILGPNGAGKSVLMRLCHGLIRPTSGTVAWSEGEDRGPQAMVFQRPVMLRRSAIANVEYGMRLKGKGKAEARRRAEDVLDAVGLADKAGAPARTLSGGEQQRLALARAWALGPEVLFLDEPTASLDPTATREVENIVGSIRAAGTKIIMSTHNLGQAQRLGDEVIYIDQGRVLERQPVDRFFRQPATLEAASFIRGELPWH
jgi:tungstate transport system ATP-binding protein